MSALISTHLHDTMSLEKGTPPAVGSPSEEELASVLDEALSAALSGRPVDRASLVARYPQLADALAAVERLGSAAPPGDRAATQPAPERVGPYRVEGVLGVGSFGIVYRGYDPHVRRHVALKLLHPDRLKEPEVVERFQREARATAQLRHPGIVRLYDYSREGPPFYLVTEFVEGLEPRAWCQQRRSGIDEIAGLVARVADAVEHAHRQGVCHRDLKPANILVDGDGNPHLLDFGLARLDVLGDAVRTAATSDGRILGSLPYMAPEQAAGRSHDADARSDVYSLGVILYELMAGRLPFDGPPHVLVARVVEDTPPSPRQFRPDLPPELEAICLKAMAKRPADRYATAAELAQDLRAYQHGEGVRARPTGWLAELYRVLDRRHHDTVAHDWSRLLLCEGSTILAGCAVVNVWEILLSSWARWAAILGTKVVQVVVMLVLAVRLRPRKEPGLTAAERQIWTLLPAYYGAFLAIMLVNLFLEEPLPLAPFLAVLSGMGFITLGATIWGWFYVWGAAFFGLAVLMSFIAPYGMVLLGLGWFVCLAVGSVHLRSTR